MTLLLLSLTSWSLAQDQPAADLGPGLPAGGLLGDNPFKGMKEPSGRAGEMDEAASFKPENAAGYAARGDEYLKVRKEYDQAIAFYSMAILCDPLHLDAREGRGTAAALRGYFAPALEDIDLVLRKNPARNWLYGLRAFLRCMTADTDDDEATKEAEDDVKKRLERSPLDPLARGVRGMIAERKGNYEQAIAELSWSIDHEADCGELRFFRGRAHVALEQFAQAIPDFEYCTRAGVRDPAMAAAAYGFLARCHAGTGNVKQALADYQKAVDLVPDDAGARWARMQFALENRAIDVALADLDRLVTQDPDEALLVFLRGLIHLLARNDLDRARADLDLSIELAPRSPLGYTARTIVDYRRKDYAQALGDLVLTCMSMRFYRLRFSCGIDHRKRFFRAAVWFEWADGQPEEKKGQRIPDLEHKLVDLGLRTLWERAVAPGRL
jgi:tetratricopeptide (TPR) repeat protein